MRQCVEKFNFNFLTDATTAVASFHSFLKYSRNETQLQFS